MFPSDLKDKLLNKSFDKSHSRISLLNLLNTYATIKLMNTFDKFNLTSVNGTFILGLGDEGKKKNYKKLEYLLNINH
jgi:hypothetical protein